jgi:enterochelin esterase-like enzyme
MTLSPPASRRRASVIVPMIVSVVVLAIVAVAALLLAAVVLFPGAKPTGIVRTILGVHIIGGLVPLIADALAVAALAVILVRRWRRLPLIVTAAAAVLGAVLAVVILWLANAQNWFGVELGTVTWIWSIATFAAVGIAAGSMVSARAWRRFIAGAAAILIVITGILGVNADIGIQKTLADFAGVQLTHPVKLPVADPTPTATPTAEPLAGGALWANWHVPLDLPSTGTTGTVEIPDTVSGFHARPAGLYLPPAALVKDPPPLPLVVMMMGQPGNPDPSWAANALNAYAAKHDGLAPIVVVADQIGNPANDTLCLDTPRFGNVETYITQDVLPWARANLRVLQDPAHTVVAGYSNGGECAIYFGSKYPELWTNVLDISGDAYPGGDRAAATLREDFHGDADAYHATWPANILASGAHTYPNSFAVFTVGSDDSFYRAQAQSIQESAKAVGWVTAYAEIPGGGHRAAAINGGMVDGFSALYPRLGLVQPGTTP